MAFYQNTKQKFTTEHWEKALSAVFVKSINDLAYRQLCLTNPREAVEVVAPHLELPSDFHFQFAANAKDVVYSYQLPPLLDDCTSTTEYAALLIEQGANALTHPPTNAPTPVPNPPKDKDDKGSTDDTPPTE